MLALFACRNFLASFSFNLDPLINGWGEPGAVEYSEASSCLRWRILVSEKNAGSSANILRME
jgi:hypothetical protein